jgi:hypothetical protein
MKVFIPNPRETYKPEDIPKVKVPEGFSDATWHNDVCPSMINEELNLRIWIEHNNPRNREYPEGPQYALTNGMQSTYENFIETNDYNEILRKLKQVREFTKLANKFSEVLREWLTDEEMQEVIERNEFEENDNICHSHDFCDGNEAMLEAMDRLDIDWILADEDPEGKDKQMDLLNGAWNRAKIHDFMQINKENFNNYK